MGLYASLSAPAAQNVHHTASPLLLTECVMGDLVLAGICEAPMGEVSGTHH